MRRIGWMFLIVLGSAGLMHAQNSASMKLGGAVCQSTCVIASSPDVSTCDPLCTDKGGEEVFVDDQGNVRENANQTATPSAMANPASMDAPSAMALPISTDAQPATAMPTEKEREEEIREKELYDNPGGGY